MCYHILAHAQHALTVTQAAGTTATSNSKDDNNNMSNHNSRNASNSRNESNSRTANTVGMPTAGMLAKVMKPATACREDNNNIDTNNMRWQQQQYRSQQHSTGTSDTAAETHN
jgi:hypothetical protein